jgi:hypothetical protein
MSVFCLVGSTARAHKKALFGNKGSRAIGAEILLAQPKDWSGKPGFFARPRAKKCAWMINIDRKK